MRDLLVGESEEGVKDAQLVEELERGGVDGVSTEVAEEIFVLFEHGDIDPGTGKKKAKHDSGRAAADYAACGFNDRHCAARVARGMCRVNGN